MNVDEMLADAVNNLESLMKQRDALKVALEALIDAQTSPPLITYRGTREAMKLANEALALCAEGDE